MADAVVVVFAKPCIPGQVKTRLIPALGAQRACQLYRCMLEQTLRTVAQIDADCELWLTALGVDTDTETAAKELGFACRQQCEGDLGDRMLHAYQSLLRRYSQVILIGSDCPALNAADLYAATNALISGYDAVLMPAEDGGYVLLGLRMICRDLFVDVPWGTADVLTTTRQRLQKIGIRHFELHETWDVDRPEDLERLADFPGLSAC